MAGAHLQAALLVVAAMCVTSGCGGPGDQSQLANRQSSASTSGLEPPVEGTTTTRSEPTPTTTVTAPPTIVGPRPTSSEPQRNAPAPEPTAPPATDQPPPTQPPPAEPTTTAPSASATITIANFTFTPPALRVVRGTMVTATNDDDATHTWTSDDGAWNSNDLRTGDRATHRFDEPGTYSYHCTIHPSMRGSVSVGD